MQAVQAAAAQQAKSGSLESSRRSGSLNKLPLEMQDGGLIRQQFYHALAVHGMAEQIKGVIRAVVAEKKKLLHMAREGAPTCYMHMIEGYGALNSTMLWHAH